MSEQPAASHQLRLHRRRPADRPADRRPAPRRPRRAAGRARLGAMRPAQRPWPEPPRRRADVSGRCGTTRAAIRDSHRLAAALDGERDRAVANDVVLRHAARRPRRGDRRRPGLAAAARDEGRLPAQPHRAFARRRGEARARRRRAAARRGATSASAPTSRPLRRARARRLAAAPPRLGTSCCSPHPRDALALQWAHLCDFYRGDAEALARARRRGAARMGRGRSAAIPTCSAARLRPRGVRPLRRGRGGRPARAGRRRRACHGRSTPSPT